jgi:Tol biopolymer transport system component/DNA-binding winged helix-turn-helix (wHTH) protein
MNDEIGPRRASKEIHDSLSPVRETSNGTTPALYEFGPFRLDPTERKLLRGNQIVALTPKAFDTLLLLVRNCGHLLEKDELIRTLWPDSFVEEGSLSNNIFLLRRALGGDPAFIETVPGRGYRFVGAVRQLPHGTSANRLREVGDSTDDPEIIETLPQHGPTFISTIETPPHVRTASVESAEITFPAPAQVKVGKDIGIKWLKRRAGILISAACAFAAVLTYLGLRPRPALPALTPVPFTDYPGFENCPQFSPDGSQIAFAWSGNPATGAEGYDLYVKVIHGENWLRLTHHPSNVISVAWSPDGTQIAFYRVSGADTGIYLVPASGGPERKLRSTRGGWGLSWSADGKWIAYPDHTGPAGVVRHGDTARIHILSLETLENRQIPHAEGCLAEQDPAFSHSGDQLAYACLLKANPNEIGIYSVSLSRGSPKLLARFMTGFGFPRGVAWTAKDRGMIVARPHLGNDPELDEITLPDGMLRKLPFGHFVCCPAVSLRGDKLAYSDSSGGHAHIWRKDLRNTEVAGAKLISSMYENFFPEYSPDGKHIAFVSGRGGDWEIWMSDPDGTNLVLMSDSKSSTAGTPQWSPDSRKLAFDSRLSGHPEVYIVDIFERLPRKLITNLSDVATPSWSHDGEWIYFQATSDQRIFRCPAGGGNAEALSASSGAFAFESYDEKAVFFVSPADSGDLHMVSLKQPGSELTVQGMPALARRSLYTVVPGGIYFVPADAPKSICYFDFATRQVHHIFNLEKEHVAGLAVSPDGRWILYTQQGVEGNSDIMLVDHFR